MSGYYETHITHHLTLKRSENDQKTRGNHLPWPSQPDAHIIGLVKCLLLCVTSSMLPERSERYVVRTAISFLADFHCKMRSSSHASTNLTCESTCRRRRSAQKKQSSNEDERKARQ